VTGQRQVVWSRVRRALVVGGLVVATASVGTAQDEGAHRGYLAGRLTEAGELVSLDAQDAGRRFVPAAVLKVVTVAAALQHLGVDYRWTTRLTAAGPVVDGVLRGDLVVEPGADPTWALPPDIAPDPLAALADQLRALGLTRVTGDLVVDATPFPGRRHPSDRPFADLPYLLGTPLADLAGDEATV